jgi:hypothetical protein
VRRAIVAATALLPWLAAPAVAVDFHVRSPNEIDHGELEIEHNGAAQFDHRKDRGGATGYTIELGTGLTSWWKTELELNFERSPGSGQPTLLSAFATENIFRLTEPGEAFVDLGLFVEYGQSLRGRRHAGPNELTFGPLIAKDIGRTTHTVNLFLTRQLGPAQETHGLEFSYAWQSRWNVWPPLSPALEIYGETGTLGRIPGLSRQQLLVGPVGVGSLKMSDLGLGRAGKLKYELGWLFGATGASPQGSLRWRLELEFPF